jgi:RimJ/RimL family protein N-acetyltransferase
MPLRASDATEMHGVLNHRELYKFTGGRPLSLAELKKRYRRLETQRSPDGSEAWLNWILRLRETEAAIGTVQAGVSSAAATLAWVVGIRWQRQGFASEAARELVTWLVTKGVCEVIANIHPENIASQVVAQRLGLVPTDEVVDGEVVWRALLAESGRTSSL